MSKGPNVSRLFMTNPRGSYVRLTSYYRDTSPLTCGTVLPGLLPRSHRGVPYSVWKGSLQCECVPQSPLRTRDLLRRRVHVSVFTPDGPSTVPPVYRTHVTTHNPRLDLDAGGHTLPKGRTGSDSQAVSRTSRFLLKSSLN